MQLAQPIRFHEHERARNQRRHREVRGRVLDLDPPSGRTGLLLVPDAEHIRVRHVAQRVGHGLVAGMAERRGLLRGPEEVGVLLRDAAEEGDVDAEVLRDDLERGVREPVGEHERRAARVEVAVGEDEQDFEPLVERLDGVGDPCGEAGGTTVRTYCRWMN